MNADEMFQSEDSTKPSRPVVKQPDATMNVHYGENSVNSVCIYCGKYVQTKTELENGAMTYVASLAICLLGGVCGCCLIPFCVDSCKDVKHTCPNCQGVIGKLKRC